MAPNASKGKKKEVIIQPLKRHPSRPSVTTNVRVLAVQKAAKADGAVHIRRQVRTGQITAQ